LKDSDVSVLEQEYGKEHQEDLKVLGNRVEMVEKAKEETGLLMGTEVANAAHVKLALEYDIDVLWVGQNNGEPFAMQELADALQGTKKIVLKKSC
jgi:chorismate mutase